MVPTEGLRAVLQAQGFRRLVVVGRGVDTERFDPARRNDALRRRWGAGAQRPRAALCRPAGRREEPARCCCAPSTPCGRWTRRCAWCWSATGRCADALRARCPQAVFAGERRGDDLAAHYASADLFVFPSLTETYGNVTPEAWPAGCRCWPSTMPPRRSSCAMATTAGWPRAATPTRCCIWRCVGRRARLAARHCGAAARRSALDLSWGAVLRQIEAVLYATLVAQHSRRPAAALLAEWGPT